MWSSSGMIRGRILMLVAMKLGRQVGRSLLAHLRRPSRSITAQTGDLISAKSRFAKRMAQSAEDGLTLLEVLVVLVILSLIAAVAAPPLIKQLSKAKFQTAVLELEAISSALDMYHIDVGRYPTQDEGLRALLSRPQGNSRWNGPYVKKAESLTDPWGKQFVYKIPGDHGDYDLYAEGATGGVPTDDDPNAVRNW